MLLYTTIALVNLYDKICFTFNLHLDIYCVWCVHNYFDRKSKQLLIDGVQHH